jgi:hypothetical protein
VTRAGDIDGVQVVFVDQPVKVNVGEALAGIGAPITEEASCAPVPEAVGARDCP